MKKFCFSLLLVFPILVFGQLRNADVYKLPEMGKENIRENINIPGFDGYEVLENVTFTFIRFFLMGEYGRTCESMRRGNKGWML